MHIHSLAVSDIMLLSCISQKYKCYRPSRLHSAMAVISHTVVQGARCHGASMSIIIYVPIYTCGILVGLKP